MKNIIIPTLTVLCLIPCNGINVNAEEVCSDTSISVYSAGLIGGYSASISSSNKSLLFTGRTNCFNTMKTVGIKSIVIQKSSDNSTWTDYTTVSDMTTGNTVSFSVSSQNIGTVTGGYYYRITCKHYAKESGLFGSSESISNTSNSVYIS